MLSHALNWITFFWLLCLAISSGRKIFKSQNYSVHVVIVFFFVFCGLPLFLDETVGRVDYTMPGFALATADKETNTIYCLYMSIVPLVLLFFGKQKVIFTCPVAVNVGDVQLECIGRKNHLLHFISWIVLGSPIILALCSPSPEEYLIFSSTLRLSEVYSQFHAYLTLACKLAVLAGIYLIATSRPNVYGRMPSLTTVAPVFLFLLVVFWIHGKRNIVVIAAVLLLMAFHYRGVLKGIRAFVFVTLAVVIALGYSFYFQKHTRRVSTTWYENVRIDFGRDDVIKMTIFAELHPGTMKILEYRGQSLLFLLSSYVPRKLWPEKPLPYAQYFTSALFRSKPRMWGWGMTTSWLEEAIANFSWFGILIGPFGIAMVCRFGSISRGIMARVLTPLIASLLMLVQASAFLPLFLLWFYCLMIEKVNYHQ